MSKRFRRAFIPGRRDSSRVERTIRDCVKQGAGRNPLSKEMGMDKLEMIVWGLITKSFVCQ